MSKPKSVRIRRKKQNYKVLRWAKSRIYMYTCILYIYLLIYLFIYFPKNLLNIIVIYSAINMPPVAFSQCSFGLSDRKLLLSFNPDQPSENDGVCVIQDGCNWSPPHTHTPSVLFLQRDVDTPPTEKSGPCFFPCKDKNVTVVEVTLSDAMWFLRLGHKGQYSFCLVLLDACS